MMSKTVNFDDSEWFEPVDLLELLKELDEEETAKKKDKKENVLYRKE